MPLRETQLLVALERAGAPPELAGRTAEKAAASLETHFRKLNGDVRVLRFLVLFATAIGAVTFLVKMLA